MKLSDLTTGAGEWLRGSGPMSEVVASRHVYVYGTAGGDGWVTPESYPALEADGFSGRVTEAAVDVRRLTADLERFELAMGEPGVVVFISLASSGDAYAKETGELGQLLDAVLADQPFPGRHGDGDPVRGHGLGGEEEIDVAGVGAAACRRLDTGAHSCDVGADLVVGQHAAPNLTPPGDRCRDVHPHQRAQHANDHPAWVHSAATIT
jgi:hypothetical protein